jgi:hypothetical protein
MSKKNDIPAPSEIKSYVIKSDAGYLTSDHTIFGFADRRSWTAHAERARPYPDGTAQAKAAGAEASGIANAVAIRMKQLKICP